MLAAGVVSAAPTIWWVSVVSGMRGPQTVPTNPIVYLALNSPFLLIPALAIVRALNLILSPERQSGQKLSLFTQWLWVLLLLNPIVYIFWLMFSLAGM